jgi:hypothetical protein
VQVSAQTHARPVGHCHSPLRHPSPVSAHPGLKKHSRTTIDPSLPLSAVLTEAADGRRTKRRFRAADSAAEAAVEMPVNGRPLRALAGSGLGSRD